MRLLLRANAHRPVDGGGREVAAAPDTPRREPWQWQVRLLAGGHGPTTAPLPGARRIAEPLPDGTVLEVAADPAAVCPDVEIVDPGAGTTVDRAESDVLVLVACGGRLLVEGRHLLADADAMVLAGADDPLSVEVRHPDGRGVPDGPDARLALVRLSPAGDRALSWVP
ncbi:hypothetical protein C1I97_01900 [Streptomyces sp. NTH33]|uniref:hypothetical protein n=1 Tax=Streptomyces sp. NTH33 TaxID=1735453 RepID=UPI000DA841FF|nr:hypothetical protein [Streptomyces sp. NTH33]PZH20048.1 hypothetical protein C1I97_01900 [Streptomyces sp. NTH33]